MRDKSIAYKAAQRTTKEGVITDPETAEKFYHAAKATDFFGLTNIRNDLAKIMSYYASIGQSHPEYPNSAVTRFIDDMPLIQQVISLDGKAAKEKVFYFFNDMRGWAGTIFTAFTKGILQEGDGATQMHRHRVLNQPFMGTIRDHADALGS